MQKKGGWKDDVREEISTPLKSEVTVILSAYKTIRNVLNGDNIETPIIQTDSYLFANDDYEIKMTCQSGKVDVYNYEIEVFDHELDPMNVASELGLPVDSPVNTPEFWKDWNSKVNLKADDLDYEQLTAIIKKYLA